MVTDAEVLDATFVAISSDTPPRAWFSSSHAMLDRFHENVVWSQRDNFVSVPTDCPQRDERLGWTGDAQAFAATGSTLFDARAFWTSWLRDLALDQDDRLGVPSVVPDVVIDGEARFGRAGWADAATIVPWAVYESYGDDQVLRDQLGSMQRHVDSLRSRLGPDGLLVPSGMQFGDWLDPDAPVARPWEAKADSEYLANAYLVLSARLAADAADLYGEGAWAADARALATRVRDTTWKRWADHAVTSQTGCAVALCLGIAPENEREAVAEALAALVRESDGRVRTGFLGTPLVLPALADAGRWEEAYLMLLREEVPSWLYQVRQGATTVWERWDAIRPDGSIHPGTMSTPPEMAERPEGDEPHMLSFNHYAYGAVIDWVYRHVAGLAPDRARPGYRHVVIAPRPVVGIDQVERRDREPVRSHRRSVAGRRGAPLQRGSRAAIRDHRHVRAAGDRCLSRRRRWQDGARPDDPGTWPPRDLSQCRSRGPSRDVHPPGVRRRPHRQRIAGSRRLRAGRERTRRAVLVQAPPQGAAAGTVGPRPAAVRLAEAAGELGRVGPPDLGTDGGDRVVGRSQQDSRALGSPLVGVRDRRHAHPVLEQPHEVEDADAELAG